MLDPGFQYHPHFWRQSRAAFAQLISDAILWQQHLAKTHQNVVLGAKSVA
jgi:hypothetical protein